MVVGCKGLIVSKEEIFNFKLSCKFIIVVSLPHESIYKSFIQVLINKYMLTRRHIRVKVLQSIYSFNQNKDRDLGVQEKFLWYSIEQMRDLYFVQLQLFVEIRKHAEVFRSRSKTRFIKDDDLSSKSTNFINNKLLLLIENHEEIAETVKKKKLNYWELDDEFVHAFFSKLRSKDWFQKYLAVENPSFKQDKDVVIKLFREIIAPSDKLYQFYEDKRLTWTDDFPLVNTTIVKLFRKINPNNSTSLLIPELYKGYDDREFARELLLKVLLNDDTLSEAIKGKTPNWDQDRIAAIDMIILKMGIAEFLYFPSIPVRVTINEYLEIAKEYSTNKSSLFINGILDKQVKEYKKEGVLNKTGRGLR